MKRIFLIILSVILAGAFLVSCKDDEINPYDLGKSLSVVSQNVIFDAPASTGDVVVQTVPGRTITASCNASWATVSVSGNTITVSVTENDNVNGRSSLMTISDGYEELGVTVQQRGFLFRLDVSSVHVGDDAQTMTLDLTHNTDVSITSSEDWLSADVDGKNFNVTVTENDLQHLRDGYIYYTAGTYTDSIRVVQYDFEKDLAGDCYLIGYNSSTGAQVFCKSTLSYDSSTSKCVLKLIDLQGWEMHLNFDPDVPSLKEYASDYVGDYTDGTNTYYVVSILWDTNKGYLTWGTGISIEGAFVYDEENELTLLSLEDNGSWSGYNITCLRFEKSTSTTVTNSTRKGLLFGIVYPTIVRLNPS